MNADDRLRTPEAATVVVLNFNGEGVLEDCLSSLEIQTWPDLEILVADNGSTDDSEAIAARHSVRWVPFGRNLGFAPGNNRAALSELDTPYVVFVNNDMRFAPDFVERLVTPLVRDPGLFSTDARQRDWEDRRDLHTATVLRRRPLSHAFRRSGGLPFLEIAQVPSVVPVRELQACAGNMAVRSSMFRRLGGFDDRMLAGWEDTDICWRAWVHGWGTLYVPDAVCWHHVGVASRSEAGRILRYRGGVEGRLYFATRCLPPLHVVAVWTLTLLSMVRDMVLGDRRKASVTLGALRRAASRLPSVIRSRGQLYDGKPSAGATLRRLTGDAGAL